MLEVVLSASAIIKEKKYIADEIKFSACLILSEEGSIAMKNLLAATAPTCCNYDIAVSKSVEKHHLDAKEDINGKGTRVHEAPLQRAEGSKRKTLLARCNQCGRRERQGNYLTSFGKPGSA